MNAAASFLEQTLMRVVLYEGKGATTLPETKRGSLLRNLLVAGYPVSLVREEGRLSSAEEGSHTVVLGEFEGESPVNATSGEAEKVFFVNLTETPVEALPDKIESLREEAEARKPGSWHPWFPVIDYDRCTNCMQCLSFCLFGVYGVSEEKEIQVQNNDKCKTNCPACSRVCPEAAIMFPKYRNGPVNGDKVSEADMQRESMKIDISALLGGDIYSTLRKRTEQAKERFSKERDDERALLERQRCLAKMQKEMDIPAEVLMSLPSPDEIARRAEEAKAKADEALGWRKDATKVEERE